MRKSCIACFAIAVLMLLGLCGCSEKVVPEGLVGNWNCREMASDCTTTTGFYALYINDDGSFSMYDTCGNPGISGTLGASKDDSSKGVLRISCEGDDFDPPSCWAMGKKDELEYELLEKGQMRLGHNGVWLSFYDEYTYEEYQIQLANRSSPQYRWKMECKGDGKVKTRQDKVYDEDVGYWGVYKLTADKPGNLTVTMMYSNGEETMYTVTFDLTVNEDGTIRENSRDGDIDEAMTS